ncbi:ATP-dependent helicase/deoxyribonuclease subunit B [compost metagenome]
MVRANHPAVLSSLDRLQSASSLTLLLRNPLGFVWKYGLGLREPELSSESLVLEPLAFGNLVHAVLDAALQIMVSQRGAGQAENIPAAIAQAVRDVAASWEALQAIPPQMLWRRTLRDVEQLSLFALTARQAAPGPCSFSEVPFGGAASKSDVTPPWDPAQPVLIPETGFRISGYIDRLDLANGHVSAAVVDYKTGKLPKSTGVLNGGKELQRCLYAFAVQELLGAKVDISAALLYLRDEQELPLEDCAAALADLQRYLGFAHINLAAGRALPGVAAGDDYDDLAFALPANAAAGYCARKRSEVIAAMGDAALVWEAQ